MDLISIILPVYNCEKWVERCIKSVLNQTYKNIELIIINDGSIDNSLEICKKYEKENVIIINRYIKDVEISKIYQNAACVVYPYISATQSGVLSLAYYFKTPILASDVPYFKDNLQLSKAGMLFKTGDIKDLKEKLLFILSSDVIELTEHGKEYYNKYYDGIAIRNKLMEIYTRL